MSCSRKIKDAETRNNERQTLRTLKNTWLRKSSIIQRKRQIDNMVKKEGQVDS